MCWTHDTHHRLLMTKPPTLIVHRFANRLWQVRAPVALCHRHERGERDLTKDCEWCVCVCVCVCARAPVSHSITHTLSASACLVVRESNASSTAPHLIVKCANQRRLLLLVVEVLAPRPAVVKLFDSINCRGRVERVRVSVKAMANRAAR